MQTPDMQTGELLSGGVLGILAGYSCLAVPQRIQQRIQSGQRSDHCVSDHARYCAFSQTLKDFLCQDLKAHQ